MDIANRVCITEETNRGSTQLLTHFRVRGYDAWRKPLNGFQSSNRNHAFQTRSFKINEGLSKQYMFQSTTQIDLACSPLKPIMRAATSHHIKGEGQATSHQKRSVTGKQRAQASSRAQCSKENRHTQAAGAS